MKAIIYTARVGGYDDVQRIEPQEGDVATAVFEDGIRHDAQVRSRWAKWHPEEVLAGLGPWEWSIWIDGSVEVLSPFFALDLVDAAGDAPMVVVRHPFHDDLRSEVDAVDGLPKCEGHGHRAMFDDLARGVPALPPAVALGVIARRRHATRIASDLVWETGFRWDSRCLRDQIVFPFVAQSLGLQPAVLDPPGGDLWANDWWHVHPHRSPA